MKWQMAKNVVTLNNALNYQTIGLTDYQTLSRQGP